jgi:exodeoxyribonuclease VII small subunit
MAKQENKTQKENSPSLEDLFQNLDEVISRLEGEEVSLEESFQLYQEGMNMLKQCNATIDTVEKKVQILDEDGELHEF